MYRSFWYIQTRSAKCAVKIIVRTHSTMMVLAYARTVRILALYSDVYKEHPPHPAVRMTTAVSPHLVTN